MRLGSIILFSFLIILACRPLLLRFYLPTARESNQPRRMFIIEMSLCFAAGLCINIHNFYIYHIPVPNLWGMLFGCLIAGFFIGLDSALAEERKAIINSSRQESFVLPQHLFPITRRFTLVAISGSIFVALVLILVFNRDVEWLTSTAHDADSIHAAQLSVTTEVFFIMAVLILLIINLIFSYSRNLKLLFDNQTRILEQVSQGDLSAKVPIATQDEFGIIAGYTNHMIDGLRHRFDLVSSLKLAEEVQQNFLPPCSPALAGYDISGISIYCDQTGGDYYDYFQLPGENRLGVVVADACGHGIGAAMLMVSVRAFLISAIKHYQSPARLLGEINQHIVDDCAKSSRFSTMFFLEIDAGSNELRWVRAGHDPALMFQAASGNFSHLDGPGLVLGVDKSYWYQDSTAAPCRRGDIVIIGTDGINETRNGDGENFGHARLKNIVADNVLHSAQTIQQAIVTELKDFRGATAQEDDITLVVIKAT